MKHLKLKGLFFLTVLLLQITWCRASHMAGAEISYKCLDALGNYKVTLVFYRDCNGVPVCSGSCSDLGSCTKTMQVRGADPTCNGTTFITFNVSGVSVRDANVNALCKNDKSNCTNMGCITPGSAKGMERYEFAGTVNIGAGSGIPTACCNIVFTFEECCRNGAIQNISPQNFYSEVQLNRCLVTYPNCNSVVFSNDFPTSLCYNQGFIYNPGAFDPDMDSLSYEYAPALYGYGVTATYISPYSYDKPLPFLPPANGAFPSGIHLNAITGDFMFTPNVSNFRGIVGFKIKEWRKVNNLYQLIGVSKREFEVQISPCNGANKMPVISHAGTPQPLVKDYEICAGKPMCIPLVALDEDFALPARSDTTYLMWDKRLEAYGATFTRTYDSATRTTYGPREDSYIICWTPPNQACYNNKPTTHTFTVTARDNQCPNSGLNVQQFRIRVYPTPGVSYHKTNRNCGTWDLTLVKDSLQKPQQFLQKKWLISKEPGDLTFANGADTINGKDSIRLQFFKTGQYLVKLELQVENQPAYCKEIRYDTITVNHVLGMKLPNDTIYCRQDNPEPVTIKAKMNASNPVRLSWYALPDTTQIIDDSIHYFAGTNFGNLHLLLVATDSVFNCQTSDEIRISDAHPQAHFTIPSNSLCTPISLIPVDSSLPVSKFLHHTWTVDTTKNYTGHTPTFAMNDGGLHSFKLKVQVGSCADSMELQQNFFAKPALPVIAGPTYAHKKVQSTYSVTDHANSTFIWSTLFGSIINENRNTISILWGEQNYGEVHVIEKQNGCESDAGFKHVWLAYVDVPELTNDKQFTIYPQPAADLLFFRGNFKQFTRYEILSLTGQRLLHIAESPDFPETIRLNQLETGVYILVLYTREGLAIGRKINVLR
ncbi:MAG: T9SS type A sorting domain-containing protein [Bacteroidia bacterium]|jgi:hypothetical protein